MYIFLKPKFERTGSSPNWLLGLKMSKMSRVILNYPSWFMDKYIQSNGVTIPHNGHWAMQPKGSLSVQAVMIKLMSHLPLKESISSLFLAGHLITVFGMWFLCITFLLIHLFPVSHRASSDS